MNDPILGKVQKLRDLENSVLNGKSQYSLQSSENSAEVKVERLKEPVEMANTKETRVFKYGRTSVHMNSHRDSGSMYRACICLCQMGLKYWEKKSTQGLIPSTEAISN